MKKIILTFCILSALFLGGSSQAQAKMFVLLDIPGNNSKKVPVNPFSRLPITDSYVSIVDTNIANQAAAAAHTQACKAAGVKTKVIKSPGLKRGLCFWLFPKALHKFWALSGKPQISKWTGKKIGVKVWIKPRYRFLYNNKKILKVSLPVYANIRRINQYCPFSWAANYCPIKIFNYPYYG